MKSNQSRRQIAGIAIVVVISLVLNIRLLLNALRDADFTAVGADMISVYETKFKDLEGKLPSKDVIGYIDDRFGRMNDAKNDSRSERLLARYYVAQYVLAPHLIEYGINHRYVIGNFINVGSSKEVIPAGAAVLADFGGGLVLFESVPE